MQVLTLLSYSKSKCKPVQVLQVSFMKKSEAGQRLQKQFVTENDLVIHRLNFIED